MLGGLCSFVVSACLLEIALNRFFAIYFGGMFAVVGSVILVRVCTGSFALPLKSALILLSIVVLFAGLASAIVDHNALGLSSGARIPLFTILGTSVSFALTFALIDVINMTVASPVVVSSQQVFALLAFAVSSGALYGTLFGLFDVEDAKNVSRRVALMHEEWVSLPLGSSLGGLAAFVNFRLGEAPKVAHLSRMHDSFDSGF